MLSLHHVIAIRTHTHTQNSLLVWSKMVYIIFLLTTTNLAFPFIFRPICSPFVSKFVVTFFQKKYVFLAEFTNLNIISAFGEAFITTFRTFITPLELIEKLTHRYSILCCQISEIKQKAAKECFSLLVRVVNDLT